MRGRRLLSGCLAGHTEGRGGHRFQAQQLHRLAAFKALAEAPVLQAAAGREHLGQLVLDARLLQGRHVEPGFPLGQVLEVPYFPVARLFIGELFWVAGVQRGPEFGFTRGQKLAEVSCECVVVVRHEEAFEWLNA